MAHGAGSHRDVLRRSARGSQSLFARHHGAARPHRSADRPRRARRAPDALGRCVGELHQAVRSHLSRPTMDAEGRGGPRAAGAGRRSGGRVAKGVHRRPAGAAAAVFRSGSHPGRLEPGGGGAAVRRTRRDAGRRQSVGQLRRGRGSLRTHDGAAARLRCGARSATGRRIAR